MSKDPPFISSTRAREGESQQAFVERQIAEQLAGFDSSRRYYRRGFFYATVATATLSASTTVLIAISKIYTTATWLSVIALLTSAAITVVSAWDGFFRHRELWVQKTDAWMALQKLEAGMNYAKTKTGGVIPPEELDGFYRNFERILTAEHGSWKKVRSTQTSAIARH